LKSLEPKAPAEIAKAIFAMQSRAEQERALSDCPNGKQVKACLNVFIERRRICRLLGKEFWL